MATLTNDEIIEALKAKSLLEISELVKQFEEARRATAAALSVAVAAPAPPQLRGDGICAAAEEQDEFDVISGCAGEPRRSVVIMRSGPSPSLGLKELGDPLVVYGAGSAAAPRRRNTETAEKGGGGAGGRRATVTVK